MRINVVFSLCLIAACASSEYPVRTTQNEGIISARARNELAIENPEGLVRIAQGFEQSGNLQGALNLYGQAMNAAPDLTEAQVGFARTTAQLGQIDRALAMLDAVLVKSPTNIGALYEKAVLLTSQQKYTEAEVLLRPILNTDELDNQILVLASKLAFVRDNYIEGRALLTRAIDGVHYNAQAIHNLAFSYALKKDYKTAIALVQQALDSPSDKAIGRNSLALVYALSGQITQAIEFHIGALSQDELKNQRLFYRSFSVLNEKELAQAVFFNHLPANIYDRIRLSPVAK